MRSSRVSMRGSGGIEAKVAGAEGRLDASIANLKVWAVGLNVALFSALAAIRFFGH